MRKKEPGSTSSAAADDIEARGRIVLADIDVGQAMLRRALLDGSDTTAARKIILEAAAATARLAQEAMARMTAEHEARQAELESAGDAVLDESLRQMRVRLHELLLPHLTIDLRS